MIHLSLFLVCVFSVEFFIRLNFLSNLNSILTVAKKVPYVISQNDISDHWKEKIIPAYALRIMKYSLQILLILSLIISIFLIIEFFINNFFTFTFSLIGIIESILFAFVYVYLRKFFIK